MNSVNPFDELEAKFNSRFEELKSLIISLKDPPHKTEEQPYLYSIKELAEFLGCSVVTAQKLKNTKRIPYFQTGRKLIFEKSKILEALQPTFRYKK
jgi:excisionase family DNA binding protein